MVEHIQKGFYHLNSSKIIIKKLNKNIFKIIEMKTAQQIEVYLVQNSPCETSPDQQN